MDQLYGVRTLIKKSHKIIHKQGFDTFYQVRKPYSPKHGFVQEKETELFLETLKYTIGVCLIIFIILDPLSLALSDEEVTYKINIDPMTIPIDNRYFEKFLGLDDIIDRTKTSEFYKNFVSSFEDKEEMSLSTYYVVRENYWDIEKIDEIEKQLDLISSYEKFIFHVLKSGIRVARFYLYGGVHWYSTSIKSNFDRHTFGGEEFQKYLKAENKYNQTSSNVYMSALKIYDEYLYLEHNELLATEEIETLKSFENKFKKV